MKIARAALDDASGRSAPRWPALVPAADTAEKIVDVSEKTATVRAPPSRAPSPPHRFGTNRFAAGGKVAALAPAAGAVAEDPARAGPGKLRNTAWAAGITFAVTVVLLALVRPPMVRKNSEGEGGGDTSFLALAMWSCLAGSGAGMLVWFA